MVCCAVPCRYRLFAEPPMLDDDEGMQALQCLTCPMDLLTMLYKVSILVCCRASSADSSSITSKGNFKL
jgi:hypothetical protein